MAIINLTPDSFFDGGKIGSETELLRRVEQNLTDGARIIDIGGQSTRPGADFISADDEWTRLEIGLKAIRKTFPNAFISVDTFHSVVAEKAVDLGVSIINDISGGSMDPKMASTIGRLKIPYVLMHIQGTPTTMQLDPHYENVTLEVWNYFEKKISELRSHGCEQIILDPGFGFGKTNDHNFSLLKNLRAFSSLKLPTLAGLSRKSMINKVLGIKAQEALNGTTVLNTLAILNGASILRVHDVIEARQVITLMDQYQKVQ